MTDYNTMTAQQCADWLAERDGLGQRCGQYGEYRHVTDYEGHVVESLDPYPMTLDGSACALREPWGWGRILWWKTGIRAVIYHATTCKKIMTEGPDELTARYRAAVAARMEDDK